jgi:hypothetical protein
MADDGINVFALTPAKSGKPSDQPKPSGKGFSVGSATPVAKPPAPSHDSLAPLKQFGSHAVDATKTVAKAFIDDPEMTTLAGAKVLFEGAVSMLTLSASGVAALAKTIAKPGKDIDSTVESFVSSQKKINDAIKWVNHAQPLKQEEAMQNFLNLIPEATQAVGDSVYEKTGNALAATGALTLSTLLTLSPELAAKVLKPVSLTHVLKQTLSTEGISHRGEMTPAEEQAGNISGRTPSVEEQAASKAAKTKSLRLSTAFDELAARSPKAAVALASHVEQVDQMTAKYMKRRIQKFIDASDKELSIIGKNAAAAAIKDLEAPPMSEIIKAGTVRVKPSKPAPKPQDGFHMTEEQIFGAKKPTPRANNASGESAASQEAVNRVASEKAAGQDRFILHADDTVTPLKGVDAPDARARKGDVIVQKGIGKDPYSVIDRGGMTDGLAKGRLARAIGLGTLQIKPALTAEQVGSTLRTAAKEGTEAITKPVEASVKPFPKQTTPGSVKDFLGAVEGGGTTKMRDQLVKSFEGFMKENAGVPGAWSINHMRETWRGKIAHSPGYSYAWSVEFPWKTESFKSELEARQYMKNVQAGVNKQIAREAVERKAKGIPDDKSPGESGPNAPLYISSGIPITRQMVESAFAFGTSAAEKLPGFKIAQSKMESLYNTYIETFNPEAKGPAARTAGAAIARNFFQQAMREHQVWEAGKRRREYWQKMGSKASMDFINSMETGKPLANPVQEKSRQAYRTWTADLVAQDQKTYAGSGKELPYEPRENYVPHLFEDSEGVIRWASKKYGNKWADPRFIKDRSFNLYQEAIDAGFTPKFTNPEDIMQARQHASDIAALRTDLLADLERKGVAQRAAKGADRPPAGFSPNSRRSPTGVRYWVREEADALMHNAFDSASLWNLQGSALQRGVSAGFRGWMGVKNALLPIKLGLSLFHPMHVLHIDASATLARESKGMLGNPSASSIKSFMLNSATAYLKPAGQMVKSVAASTKWTNERFGYPVLRVFQGKMDFERLSEADKAAFRDLAEGGMVPTRPKEETSGSIQKFNDAIAKRSVTAAFHLPFAVLSAISHPLFGEWIPTLKIASYLKDVKVARELNPNWTDGQRQEAFRQIARKVEARYGEMNYNSLFMDKMAKDIGVATNLSLGWNIGLLDQYVGGAIDLGKATKRIGLDVLDPESKGSEVKRQLAAGTLDRPVFAAYYVGTALMIGGIMHYMFTGKQPQQLIDYTHPESGEKDQYGKPIRLNTMFYTREFEGLAKHMEQQGAVSGLGEFIGNKGSGLMEMSRTALTGVNSLGNDIRNPEDPVYKQFEQTLLNTLSGLDPISVEAIRKSTGSPVKDTTLDVLGFTQAGKYISETVTEGQIADRFNRYVRPKEKPFKAVEMGKDVKQLREMLAKDDPKYDDKLEAAAKKYDLTDKDIHRLEKLFNSPKEQEFDPSVFMFQKLPWEIQKPLLDKMSPEERETYLPHISKEKRQKYERSLDNAS